MQSEETFRDAKSSRYGLSLSHARTNSEHRANTLLLLAAFTHVLLVLVGAAAEAAQLHIAYQANTVRNRRVLSLATLGRLIVRREAPGLLQATLASGGWDRFMLRIDAALTL